MISEDLLKLVEDFNKRQILGPKKSDKGGQALSSCVSCDKVVRVGDVECGGCFQVRVSTLLRAAASECIELREKLKQEKLNSMKREAFLWKNNLDLWNEYCEFRKSIRP